MSITIDKASVQPLVDGGSVLRGKTISITRPVKELKDAIATASKQSRRFINHISNDTKISTSQKEALINVAALTDALVNNPSGRGKLFKQLSQIAVYISNTSKNTFPNYDGLTGLRFYGGKRLSLASTGQSVESGNKKQTTENLHKATRKIEMQMEQIVQQERNISIDDAISDVVSSPELSKEAMESVGVDKVIEGIPTDLQPQKVVDA